MRDRERWLSVYGEQAAAQKIRDLQSEAARLQGVVERQKAQHYKVIAAIRAVQNHFGKVHELLTLAEVHTKEE